MAKKTVRAIAATSLGALSLLLNPLFIAPAVAVVALVSHRRAASHRAKSSSTVPTDLTTQARTAASSR